MRQFGADVFAWSMRWDRKPVWRHFQREPVGPGGSLAPGCPVATRYIGKGEGRRLKATRMDDGWEA
jgi:hypothetical protein